MEVMQNDTALSHFLKDDAAFISFGFCLVLGVVQMKFLYNEGLYSDKSLAAVCVNTFM